MINTKKKKQ